MQCEQMKWRVLRNAVVVDLAWTSPLLDVVQQLPIESQALAQEVIFVRGSPQKRDRPVRGQVAGGPLQRGQICARLSGRGQPD